MPIVRGALASGNPLELLTLVSFMMTSDDPRPVRMFDRSDRSEWARNDRAQFIAELVADPSPESSALLAVYAEFIGADDDLVSRISAELATRPPPPVEWLAGLGGTTVDRAVRVSHVLDGEDVLLLQARLSSTDRVFTCLVLIGLDPLQHVRECVFRQGPIETAMGPIEWPVGDFRCEDVELADVRARLTQVIGWESTFPPRETTSWPWCRTVLEWLIRLLPEGGCASARPDPDDDDDDELVRGFLASRHGAAFGLGELELVEALIWRQGIERRDPLRWNLSRARDWLFGRMLDPSCLEHVPGREAAPAVMKAFIRFAHDEVGIRAELTDEILAAIESWESEFQERLHRVDDEEDDDWFDVAAGDG